MRRLALLALLFGVAAAANAQERGAEDWIRPEAVPARADALMSELATAAPDAAKRDEFDRIERSLAELTPKLDALRARIDAALAASVPLDKLADLRRELAGAESSLEEWRKPLEAELQRVTAVLDALARAQATWSATSGRPEVAETDEVVARQIRASLDRLQETSASLAAWRDRVLALADRVVGLRTALASTLARLDQSATTGRAKLLVPDRAPLWQTGYAGAVRSELPRVPETIASFAASTYEYLIDDPRPLIPQVLVGALVAVVFHRAGRAQRRTAAAPELADATRALERPYSIAVLLALITTPWLQPLAPRRFVQALVLIALIPVARVVTHTSRDASRLVLASLFGLLVLDRVSLAVDGLPAVSQTIFVIEMGIGLALAIHVARRGGLPGERGRVRIGATVVALALAIALVAQLGGWTALATLIGRGAHAATLAAVYIWAAVAALDALMVWILETPPGKRYTRDRGFVVHRRVRRWVRWLAAGYWLYVVLLNVGLNKAAVHGLRGVLAAGISVGALSITLGGVLAFTLTILAAPIAARLINTVLTEAVYPRAQLARGMPYALSTTVRYVVYTLAVLVALAAAGVRLDQLSIMLGGLGVGVGLGLQDFVKNFAAGLTLLFERRVHVGDVVQIPSREVFGRVREIGMRAVMVRNWDGAEVIVPNIDLISGAVTNWTLSDQLRRIELPVGAAYGTDPERVVSLLLVVAQAHDAVLDHPPPQALFQGFGESSLDFLLRVWSDSDYDRTLAIRSELALATHRSLREAGIAIPFPQRDLHLASVSPAVRAAFERKREDED
jgi:potassium-dependent mechanosensitive channel